jgi:hypothetical protein
MTRKACRILRLKTTVLKRCSKLQMKRNVKHTGVERFVIKIPAEAGEVTERG